MTTLRISWIGIAAACLGALSGCSPSTVAMQTNGAAPEKLSTQPTLASASNRDIVGYALLNGQLDWPAKAQADIAAPNVGAVDTVLARVGDHVNRGQVLVTLQSAGVASAMNDATSQLSSAEAAYQAAKIQYSDPVRQAQEQLDAAQQAEREARDGGDPTAIQSATDARHAAESALQQARALEISNLATAKEQVDEARGAAKDTSAAKRKGEITAPISGTITALNASAGATIGGTNSSVGKVVDLQAVQIKATYSDDYQKFVRPGAAVVITFADLPNKIFDGRVSVIRSEPNSQGVTVHLATVSVSNRFGLIHPDSRLQRVGIRIGTASHVLSVPVGALVRDSTGTVHVTSESGEQIKVRTGMSDGEYMQIVSGLSDGSKVWVNRQ